MGLKPDSEVLGPRASSSEAAIDWVQSGLCRLSADDTTMNRDLLPPNHIWRTCVRRVGATGRG